MILREPEPPLDPPENPRQAEWEEAEERFEYLNGLCNTATELKEAFEHWLAFPRSRPDGLTSNLVNIDLPWLQQVEAHLAGALDIAQGVLNRLEDGDE